MARVVDSKRVLGSGLGASKLKDFKFVPLMFVPLSFGSQISLLRAIFHNLGTQNPRVQTEGYKGKLSDKPPGVARPVKGPATIGRRLLSKEKQGLNPDSAPEKTCEEPCLDTHIRV